MDDLTFVGSNNQRTLRAKQSYKDGKIAEQKAVEYLIWHNYAIVTTNYKTSYGEIDILATYPKPNPSSCNNSIATLVACEVKTRKDKTNLLYTIGEKQQLRIQNALLHFIAQNETYNTWQVRFDALFVSLKEGTIKHIINAWDYNEE